MNPSAGVSSTPTSSPPAPPGARVIGVGGAGLQVVEGLLRQGLPGIACAGIHTDARRLQSSPLPRKLLLGGQVSRGLKAGEPEVSRRLAEAEPEALRHLCEGADLIILVGGLGGNTAAGAMPVLARAARESGALALVLATLPFDFEGRRRQVQARTALEELRSAADAVISLPNQKVAALLDERTPLTETLEHIDELLGRGVHGLLRLLRRDGLINVDFADLCQVVRGRPAESCFATAEAEGENRARDLVEKLARHPLLDSGRDLAEADALLISLTGGPDLSLKDVNQVMEHINRAAEHAQMVMGALMDPALNGRLAATVIVSRRSTPELAAAAPGGKIAADPAPPAAEFPTHDAPGAGGREQIRTPGSGASRHFVPPPPELTPEQAERLLAERAGPAGIRRRARGKPEQIALPLQVVSKGRFARTDPTVYQGMDLDVPTFRRRGILLN